MSIFKTTVFLLVLSTLSACGGAKSSDPGAVAPAAVRATYDVKKVNVGFVPGIEVSHKNSYFPGADVVWREDPYGDRLAQVRQIMQDALQRGVAPMKGRRSVVLDVHVSRFHALTEKTRYSGLPATHDIQFTMIVRDAVTGVILEGPRHVAVEFKALTGDDALEADARGQTQKVRITAQVAALIRRELGWSG